MAGKVVCSFPSQRIIDKWNADKAEKLKAKAFLTNDEVITEVKKVEKTFKLEDLFGPSK